MRPAPLGVGRMQDGFPVTAATSPTRMTKDFPLMPVPSRTSRRGHVRRLDGRGQKP